MKKLKKLTAIFASVLFITIFFTAAVSSASIPTSHWAINYADFVTNMGIISATRSTFSPEQSLTRAETAYALAKTKNPAFASTSTSTGFSDVPSSHKYASAIKWAVDNGIVNGFPEGTFRPNAGVLRKDFCVMLYRYCNKFNVTLPYTYPAQSFTDSGDIPAYASTAVSRLQRAGVINGFEDGAFRPNVDVRRGEAAAAFTRIHGLQYNKDNSINLYINNTSGVPLKDAKVYIYRQKYGTGDMYPYTPGTSTREGISQTIQIPSAGYHGINVIHNDYGSVPLPDQVKPSKFYVFVTLPSRSTNIAQSPVSGFTAITKWAHGAGTGATVRCNSNCQNIFTRICQDTYLNAQVPQNFGWRYGVNSDLEFHQAVDISYPTGTAVRNVFKGAAEVVASDYLPGCGNTVQLQDESHSVLLATYMHLNTRLVSIGDTVQYNGQVGTVGSTETASPHLHLSISEGNAMYVTNNNPAQIAQFKDPLTFIN